MVTEITKGALAVLLVGGAIASLFLNNVPAQEFLIPLAAFAFGYYFKQLELPVTRRVKAALGK